MKTDAEEREYQKKRNSIHDKVTLGSLESYSMIGNSSYEKNQHMQGLERKKSDMIKNIASLEKEIMQEKEQTSLQLMDVVEKIIATCGGELKIQFLEVSSTFIKVFTRVPMEANLYSFLPESKDNPRFHKVVTKILLLVPSIDGVKWMPGTIENRGAYLLVSLRRS